jgi:hypothetical protein
MAYYQLQDYPQAKRELEISAATAEETYLKDGTIWKYLEATCRALNLKDEVDHYASLARPS